MAYAKQEQLSENYAEGYETDEPEEKQGFLEGLLESGNIVDKLEDNAKHTAKTLELLGEAKQSMGSWRKKYKRAINLAKLKAMAGDTEITEKSFPFEGASMAMLPFVSEAMIDFNARSAPELVWSENIVRARIYGGPKFPEPKTPNPNQQQDPNQQIEEAAGKKIKDIKEERAERVSKYQNYQLAEGMPNWRGEQDKNLMILPCVGTSYKMTYFDYDKKEVCSDLYLADQIIFDHKNNNFRDAEDVFLELKYTTNEVLGFIRGENGWDMSEDDLDEDVNSYDFVKAYTLFDLDDDGLKEPYCAIVCMKTTKIVALYPYYDEDTINRNDDDEIISIDTLDCITQYRFLPDPEGGPMGLGWGILFGPMFEAINTSLRQLIDSTTMSIAASSSGFISMDLSSGLGNSTQAGPVDLVMGKMQPLNIRGGSFKDAFWQPPFAGPTPVMFQLLDWIEQKAKSMTNAAVNIESIPGEAAALYAARLRQSLKVPNSITMRVYSDAKKEKAKIGLLNHKHYDDELYNKILDEGKQHSMERDFDPDDCDIRLAVDPAQGSDIERIQRAEVVLQEAKTQPQQILNLRIAYVGWLEALDIPNMDELAPEPDPNAVDEDKQLMIAQMQAEIELKKEDQELRRGELDVKKMKMAHESAKEMESLGLISEKQRAEIGHKYAETLKIMYEIGLGAQQGAQAIRMMDGQFDTIFDAEGGASDRQIPQSIPNPGGPMVNGPSNPGI